MKDYDTDERVQEYLAKIENNKIEYLFTDLTFNPTEDVVAITIDILDNDREHCLLLKSLTKRSQMRPIFNMKPSVVFSADGKFLYYIQRSAEGGWIQLVKRTVETCWDEYRL